MSTRCVWVVLASGCAATSTTHLRWGFFYKKSKNARQARIANINAVIGQVKSIL